MGCSCIPLAVILPVGSRSLKICPNFILCNPSEGINYAREIIQAESEGLERAEDRTDILLKIARVEASEV